MMYFFLPPSNLLIDDCNLIMKQAFFNTLYLELFVEKDV